MCCTCQGWFMAQVARLLAARGRRMVGWDEVIDALSPQDAVIMAWHKDGHRGAGGPRNSATRS
jgi:N-acetyl-beta-hexosaminidase